MENERFFNEEGFLVNNEGEIIFDEEGNPIKYDPEIHGELEGKEIKIIHDAIVEEGIEDLEKALEPSEEQIQGDEKDLRTEFKELKGYVQTELNSMRVKLGVLENRIKRKRIK